MLTSWLFANLLISVIYSLYVFERPNFKVWRLAWKSALLMMFGVFLIAFHMYMENKKPV